MKVRNRLLFISMAMIMTLVMVFAIMPKAQAASPNAVSMTVTTISPRTATYATLAAAMADLSPAESATFLIQEDTGETGAINIKDKTGSISISAKSGVVLKAPIYVVNSKVSLSYLRMEVSGTAVTIGTNGEVVVGTNATLIGNYIGLRNDSGNAVFIDGNGSALSSYNENTAGGATHTGTIPGVPAATPTGGIKTPMPIPTGPPTGAIAVTGITPLLSSSRVYVGQTFKLSANVVPSNATNQLIYWSVSDARVADYKIDTPANNNTVTITVYAVGVTTITASTAEGKFKTAIELVSSMPPATATPRPTATPTPRPTATPGGYNGDAARYVASYAKTTLSGKNISSSTTKSSIRVTKRPLSYSSRGSWNNVNLPTDAFYYLDNEGYESFRYDLPWIDIDVFPEAADGMSATNFSLGVRKVTSFSSTMRTQWNSISKKNLSGPWELTSNSYNEGFQIRFDLPKYYAKSKLRLVYWTGTRFADISSSQWSLVKLGTKYMVRSDLVGYGTYAVLYR